MDNPFGNLLTPAGFPPSSAGMDVTKEIIKQLGEHHVGPKFEGPGAWWGHAVDASSNIRQALTAQQLKRMAEAQAQNTASGGVDTLFGQQPSSMTTPVQPKPLNPNQGMMRLGGPTPSSAPGPAAAGGPQGAGASPDGAGGAPPQQLAQASPPSSPNSFAQPAGPGQQGLPSTRLETKEELHALVAQLARMGMPPNQIMDVINNYRDRSAGYKIESPTGLVTVTPKVGGGAVQANHPEVAPTLPITAGGVSTHIQPTPGGGGNLITPSGGLESLKPMVDFGQQMEAQGKNLAGKAQGITDEQIEVMKQGIGANTSSRFLNELQSLNSNPNLSRGPTHDFAIKARQLLQNFAPDWVAKYWSPGLPDTEVYDKLNFYLASDYAKSLSSRVSNFNLDSTMRSNPSLMHSQAGANMLIDLMQQDLKAKQDLSQKAAALPKEQYQQWPQVVKDYYDQNYPKLHEPGKPTVHLKQFSSPDDMKKQVPKGERFLLPDGTIGINR